MKRVPLFLVFFAVAAVASESTVVRIGARTEIVSAPKYGVDLGVIDQHRKVDCSFTVTNRNWRERRVLGIRSSCACLETDVEFKTLARGEALPVKVIFNPAGMEGPVEKVVTLRLEGKEIEYPIKADVRLRLGFRPNDLCFGIVPAGNGRLEDNSRSCMLGGYVSTNVTVELVAPATPFFDVQLKDGVMTAAFRAETRYPGLYAETWEVKTSDPELPVLKVPVSARVSGGLSVTPHFIELPREGGLEMRQVLIREGGSSGKSSASNQTRAFKVLSAETKPRKWGDVKILRRPLNGWMIRIDGIDPVAVRQFSKKPFLEVKTDYPGMESFSIPVNRSLP
jgi:hypothetical protein